MGDVAFKAVRRGNHVLFIYLTAGDENRGPDYWRTRERAALQSTRLAAGRSSDTSAAECASVIVRSHSVRRCVLSNTVSFFMRLPRSEERRVGKESRSRRRADD